MRHRFGFQKGGTEAGMKYSKRRRRYLKEGRTLLITGDFDPFKAIAQCKADFASEFRFRGLEYFFHFRDGAVALEKHGC